VIAVIIPNTGPPPRRDFPRPYERHRNHRILTPREFNSDEELIVGSWLAHLRSEHFLILVGMGQEITPDLPARACAFVSYTFDTHSGPDCGWELIVISLSNHLSSAGSAIGYLSSASSAIGYLGSAIGYLGSAIGYLGSAIGYLGSAIAYLLYLPEVIRAEAYFRVDHSEL